MTGNCGTGEPVLPTDAELLTELAEYVAIPSISRSASADWLAARLDFVGGRVEETDGFPVVRGEWLDAPGASTVLVYGHYEAARSGTSRG